MAALHKHPQALKGVRILSLSLNLPGPAALLRLKRMGANCVKLEPPTPDNAPEGTTGDPMSAYSRTAYEALHPGIRVLAADLKPKPARENYNASWPKPTCCSLRFGPAH